MGNYEELKQAVADVIKTNGNQEITGAILQNTLKTIISTVGNYATFAGIATPETNPGTPDQNVFYLAAQNGIYSNFGGKEIKEEAYIFYNKNGEWANIKTNIPTLAEVNKIKGKQGNFFFSYYNDLQSGYIKNGGLKAGDVVSLTPIQDDKFKYAILDVDFNKIYCIKGIASGGETKLYSFIDSENKLISGYTADGSLDARENAVYLYPPINAKKLICNFLVENNPYSLSISTENLNKIIGYEYEIDSDKIVSEQFFYKPIEWIKGGYIRGTSGIIDVDNVIEQNELEYTIQDAKQGDIFLLKGKGSVNARLYLFLDSTNKVLIASGENVEGTFILKAPANTAKLICNSFIGSNSILRLATDLFLRISGNKNNYEIGYYRDSGYGVLIKNITNQDGFFCIKKNVKEGEHYKISAKLSDEKSISAFILTDIDGLIYYRSLQGDIDNIVVDIRKDGYIYINSQDENQISIEKVELSEPYRKNIYYTNIEWKEGKLENGFFNKVTETPNYHYTDLIPIQPNTDYIFSVALNNGSHICFFDGDKKLIWVVDNNTIAFSNSYTHNIRVKTPFLANYVQLCNATSLRNIDKNPIIIVDNFTFSAYRKGLLQENGGIIDYHFHVTDWIPVFPGEKWAYNGALKNGAYICFYTRNRKHIISENITGDSDVEIEGVNVTPWRRYIEIDIPQNAYWMLCCGRYGGDMAYKKKSFYEKKFHYKYDGYIDKYDDVPTEGVYEVAGDYYSIISGVSCKRGDIISISQKKIISKFSDNNLTFKKNKLYDVCVIGIGSSGIGAAYALKDSGLNVCMIDRESVIGGTIVNAGINSLLPTTAPTFLRQIISYLVSKGFSTVRGTGVYDDTFATYVDWVNGTYSADNYIEVDRFAFSDKILKDISGNIDILTNARLIFAKTENGYVKSIGVCTPCGYIDIVADTFIDCSGGNLCMLCNSQNGENALINDGYYVGADPKNLYNEANILDGYQGNKYAINAAEINYTVGIGEEDLTNVEIPSNAKIIALHPDSQYPLLSIFQSNLLGVGYNDLVDNVENGYYITYKLASKIIKGWWKYAKQTCTPIYDSYKFLNPSAMLGIRELYRIHCENMMTQDDLNIRINPNELNNNIACCTWYVDLHGSEGVNNYKNIPVTNCGIPYQSLIPKYLKNVLVACRALGTSHIANACVRLTKTMMMVGNAAGYAAEEYILNKRTDFRDVNVTYIQSKTKLSEQSKKTNDLLDSKL